MKLSIIVPAHNEEQRIGRMLDAYLPYFQDKYGDEVEFIVAINGSSDTTESVVDEYARGHSCIKIVVEPKNIGKGGGLIMGFKTARGELVGFADADGSTPPEAFDDLVESIGSNAAIIASRWCRGADVSPRQPLKRRIASRVFNFLTRIVFGLRLTDTQCGAKVMRADALKEVLPHLGITRWAFDVDLLFQLKRKGGKIVEIPTTWCDVAGSKLQVVMVSIEMFLALVRLRLMYSPLHFVVTLYDRVVGPFIHPPGLKEDYLLRHSLLLMLGSQAVNVFNLFFQLAMIRMLAVTDKAEYGIMAAMHGVFLLVSMPFGNALMRTLSHYSAGYISDGKRDHVIALMGMAVRSLTILIIALLAVTYMMRSGIVAYFNLDSSFPVVITVLALVATLYRYVFVGVLNGAQAFVWDSGIGILLGICRFVFAIVFVSMGFAAIGAISGNVAAAVITLLLSYYGVRRVMLDCKPDSVRFEGVYGYFLRYFTAMLGFAALFYMDLVLVKHYFTPEDAGAFSVASNVAKIVVFLPMPIASAMFPKVVSGGEADYRSWRILLKALVVVGIIVATGVIICTAFAATILQLLGQDPVGLVPLVRAMSWALAPVSIVFVIMSFELAQRRFLVTIPLVVCAFGYIVGVTIWHESLMQIISVLAVSTVSALILLIMCLFKNIAGKGVTKL